MLALSTVNVSNITFLAVGLCGMLGTLGAALLTLRAATATHNEVRSPNGTTTAEAVQLIKNSVVNITSDLQSVKAVQIQQGVRTIKIAKELHEHEKVDEDNHKYLIARHADIKKQLQVISTRLKD